MLMFTTIVTEVTAEGPKHMLVFVSPNVPGALYKVEADAAFAARMRILINTEVQAVAVTEKMLGSDDGDGQSNDDSFNRC